jgi:hypothetical protein
VRKLKVALVFVLLIHIAANSSPEQVLRHLPPYWAVRRRRRCTNRYTNPLDLFACSSASSRARPRRKPWLDVRSRATRTRCHRSQACSPPPSCHKRCPPFISRSVAQIDSCRSQYRSTTGSRACFAKETLGSFVFAAAVQSVQK